MKRIIKTCTWQILGIIWFMGYALMTGGDMWYTFGLALASIPAGSIMFYCHEWIWDNMGNHGKIGSYLKRLRKT